MPVSSACDQSCEAFSMSPSSISSSSASSAANLSNRLSFENKVEETSAPILSLVSGYKQGLSCPPSSSSYSWSLGSTSSADKTLDLPPFPEHTYSLSESSRHRVVNQIAYLFKDKHLHGVKTPPARSPNRKCSPSGALPRNKSRSPPHSPKSTFLRSAGTSPHSASSPPSVPLNPTLWSSHDSYSLVVAVDSKCILHLFNYLQSCAGLKEYSVFVDLNCMSGIVCLAAAQCCPLGGSVGIARSQAAFQCCLMNWKVAVERGVCDVFSSSSQEQGLGGFCLCKEEAKEKEALQELPRLAADAKSANVPCCGFGLKLKVDKAYDLEDEDEQHWLYGATHVYFFDAELTNAEVSRIASSFLSCSSCRVYMTYRGDLVDDIMLSATHSASDKTSSSKAPSSTRVVLLARLEIQLTDQQRYLLSVYLKQDQCMHLGLHRNRDRRIMAEVKGLRPGGVKPGRHHREEKPSGSPHQEEKGLKGRERKAVVEETVVSIMRREKDESKKEKPKSHGKISSSNLPSKDDPQNQVSRNGSRKQDCSHCFAVLEEHLHAKSERASVMDLLQLAVHSLGSQYVYMFLHSEKRYRSDFSYLCLDCQSVLSLEAGDRSGRREGRRRDKDGLGGSTSNRKGEKQGGQSEKRVTPLHEVKLQTGEKKKSPQLQGSSEGSKGRRLPLARTEDKENAVAQPSSSRSRRG